MGAAGGAARGSLVNSRWVGSGYGRWVGGSVELSVTVLNWPWSEIRWVSKFKWITLTYRRVGVSDPLATSRNVAQ